MLKCETPRPITEKEFAPSRSRCSYAARVLHLVGSISGDFYMNIKRANYEYKAINASPKYKKVPETRRLCALYLRRPIAVLVCRKKRPRYAPMTKRRECQAAQRRIGAKTTRRKNDAAQKRGGAERVVKIALRASMLLFVGVTSESPRRDRVAMFPQIL